MLRESCGPLPFLSLAPSGSSCSRAAYGHFRKSPLLEHTQDPAPEFHRPIRANPWQKVSVTAPSPASAPALYPTPPWSPLANDTTPRPPDTGATAQVSGGRGVVSFA